MRGEGFDFAAAWAEAAETGICANCGSGTHDRDGYVSSPFCSVECQGRFDDRRRYWENVEKERARARAYYHANRELVLDKQAARRGGARLQVPRECSECGGVLKPPRRVVCSERCREARYKRLHPESYAAREAAKVVRRRERRREARGS